MRHVFIMLCFFVLASYKKVPYSISDNGIYPAYCERAALDSKVFELFKQDPYYNLIVEYNTYEEGLEDLAYIRSHYPELLQYIEKFRTSDLLGSPRVYDYEGIGSISPTTLHYIKLVGDIKQQFGSLDGFKMIEIGSGYGGLCKILCDLFIFESYTLVDLPGPLALAKKNLVEQGIEKIRFICLDALKKDNYDLVISNFGFSECDRRVQNRFFEKILLSSKRGYLVCDLFPKHFKVRPLGRAELIKKLNKNQRTCMIKNEDPLMGKNHFIICWE